MIKRIVLALLFGTAGSLYLLQDDYYAKQWIHKNLTKLIESAFDCSVTGSVKNFTLITPSIELENVVMCPKDASNDWRMAGNTLRIRCSWFSLLCYATLDLSIYCKKLRIYSKVTDGELSIVPFIQQALSSSSLPIPIYLRSCTIHDGNVTVNEPHLNARATLSWDSVSHRRDGVLHSNMRAHSGFITSNGRTHCQNAMFTVQTTMLNQETDLSLSGRCELAQMTETGRMCEYSCSWDGKKGTFLFENADKTIVVNPASLNVVNGKHIAASTIRAPLSYCATIFATNDTLQPLNGDCCLRVLVDFSDLSRGINGTLTIKNACYKDTYLVPHARISFVSIGQRWRGSHQIQTNPLGELGGTWTWSWPDKKLICDCKNRSIIEWPGSTHWTSWPGDCSLSIVYTTDNVLRGTYACNASSKKTEESIGIDGSLHALNDTVKTKGKIGSVSYHATSSLSDGFYLQSISCFDENKEEVLTFLCDDGKQWEVQLKISLIRSLLKRTTSYDVQGEGAIAINGIVNWERPSVYIDLQDGTIRLPGTYNFVNKLHAQVALDVTSRRITMRNLICGLHYGNVSCSQATITCDDKWIPQYVHCPLTLRSCLFTFNKDCFLTTSGGMLMQGDPTNRPTLTAHLIMDRAQLGGSIPLLNAKSQSSIPPSSTHTFLKNIDCDITVTSKHPVALVADNFKAQAQVQMNMVGSPSDPVVLGDITLASGEITFPYRPLYITRGHIHFIPGQLDDPVIELIAKNRVKQHNVTMRVSGSAQQHDIMFESSPPLTNQQIISLLLSGSSDDSLNVIMPAPLVQNMKNIMSKSNTIGRLSRWFRYITFVPSFSDQTGRGGLRGSLKIDIGDRLHGLFQKNFSLSEDTLFELEYDISDDIAMRVYRDQRRDVGAEVEVRWKW